uniref:Achaete-scute family bHLH transcription factor 4 n=1 Tax=Scleropages formosus TaxID=113540 RepID=A0A8C9SFY0_SCLFO
REVRVIPERRRWPYSRSAALGLGKETHAASLRDALGLPFHLEPTYLDPAYCHAYTGRFSYLPFPAGHLGVYDYSFEPTFIRKRNERERQRVRCVNEGYARLREHLPQELEDKRLSKVETLRAAISYIKHLQGLLGARAALARDAGEPQQQQSDCSSDGESKHSSGFSDCGEVS